MSRIDPLFGFEEPLFGDVNSPDFLGVPVGAELRLTDPGSAGAQAQSTVATSPWMASTPEAWALTATRNAPDGRGAETGMPIATNAAPPAADVNLTGTKQEEKMVPLMVGDGTTVLARARKGQPHQPRGGWS